MIRFREARIVRDKNRPTLFNVELEVPVLGQDSRWENVGPMSYEEAVRLKEEHESIPSLAAKMEQSPAYLKLARTIRKTRTPEYRAALKKQNEVLKGFEPTPFPPIRWRKAAVARWTDYRTITVSALCLGPEPFTDAEIQEYQRIDRERKIKHMQATRNRAKQPAATSAAASSKARKTAADAEHAHALRAKGATNATIARELRLSIRQVQRLLKK